MFRDGNIATESDWTAGKNEAAGAANAPTVREIDRELRRIAKTRAGLDAEEARWLRHAEAQRVWRALGFATALEYLEEVFGYAPRTAMERLRVAKALGELPDLDVALRDGELSYSAVRELSRVATPQTVRRWLDRARGRNLRDIERLVNGHAPGDDPDDEKKREHEMSWVGFQLSAVMRARVRDVRRALGDEQGRTLDDEALFDVLCRRALDGGGDSADKPGASDGSSGTTSAAAGKPAWAIHMTAMCRKCGTMTIQDAGQSIEVGDVERSLALCDAVVFDDEHGKRATQTIPPVTRRKVMHRDGYACRVPGCRSTRNLDVHHIEPRAEGGNHDPANLIVMCSGHHKLLHEGHLKITGRAPDRLAFERDGQPMLDVRREAEVDRVIGRAAAEAPPTREVVERVITRAVPVPSRVVGASASRARVPSRLDEVERGASRARVPSRLDEVERVTMAKQALRQSGYTADVAKRAVEAARAHVGADADLAKLVMEALKCCK